MNNTWYELIDTKTPISQADIIFDCPLVKWNPQEIDFTEQNIDGVLSTMVEVIAADVVVLTQACDIENNKVSNLVLCSHCSLGEYKSAWEQEMKRKTQNPTDKSWRRHCSDISDGFIWNLSMLNCLNKDEHKMDIRIVDFHEIFNVPLIFLESLIKKQGKPRFRLIPPYREHLSQAFARFFMRVALPVPIDITSK